MTRLEELTQQAAKINDEIDKIKTKEWLAKNRKMIGKCFKYRNNYSCPETDADYWWLYSRVIAVDDDGGLIAFEFQTELPCWR